MPVRLHVRCALASFTLLGLCASIAAACPVCYGDPESDMGKGVTNGVLFLLAIIGGVLAGVAGITGFFMYRAYRIGALCISEGGAERLGGRDRKSGSN
jgi:hypothetical protein